MLPASNSRTLMPLGITSVVATYVGRWALASLTPAFDIPSLQQSQVELQSIIALLWFIPFGIVTGLVSVIFVKAVYWSEDFFEAMPGTYYSRHSIGMLVVDLVVERILVLPRPLSLYFSVNLHGHCRLLPRLPHLLALLPSSSDLLLHFLRALVLLPPQLSS